MIRVKEESPLEEKLSINFVIVIHAFRFLIKGIFLMFKLNALLSVLLLSACASTTNNATPDYAPTPVTPVAPKRIEYSPNVKPTTSSFDALGLYLDDVIHGGAFSSHWCKNTYSLRSELFAQNFILHWSKEFTAKRIRVFTPVTRKSTTVDYIIQIQTKSIE